MIYFNGDIKQIHYSGFTISKIYACGGNLVWSGGTTPPAPTGNYRIYVKQVNDVDAYSYCDNPSYSGNYVSQNEIHSIINYSPWVNGIKEIYFGSCPNLSGIGETFLTNSDNYTITSVTFDNSSITSIGNSAFTRKYGLTTLNLPDNITYIGNSAFNKCSGLTNVTIGSGITNISNGAFMFCSGLTGVTINATTPPTLGEYVFDYTNNCPIYVPCNSVDAYKAATNWSTYASRIQAIPGTCSSTTKFFATYTGGITYSAECDSNTTLTTETTKPAGYTFTDMESAVIGDCITNIYRYAFETPNGQTSKLKSVIIPDSVTSIGEYAFHRCGNLESISIPSGVTSISADTFKECYSLSSVTLTNTLTTIGAAAFYNCSGLTSIIIPDSVTTIGGNAFQGCSGLTSITIPSGVTSIDSQAFYRCTNLTGVTVEAITPPTLGNQVFNYTGDCPIYVPTNSVSAYQSADGWGYYADRIQAIQ